MGIFNINVQYLPISNQSKVLHGSSLEIRNGDHVHLWQRILDLEEVLEEFNNLWPNIQCIFGRV